VDGGNYIVSDKTPNSMTSFATIPSPNVFEGFVERVERVIAGAQIGWIINYQKQITRHWDDVISSITRRAKAKELVFSVRFNKYIRPSPPIVKTRREINVF